jgi:hypothetical protein
MDTPRIQTEFTNVLDPLIEDFFTELLAKDPSWLSESILEDESGDVFGGLLSLLIDYLRENA